LDDQWEIRPRLELGYIEGQNIIVDYRFGENRDDRMADLVAKLVQLRPDVLGRTR
jgi:putative tryptophan/tyrosine transport system substrate-binding protein